MFFVAMFALLLLVVVVVGSSSLTKKLLNKSWEIFFFSSYVVRHYYYTLLDYLFKCNIRYTFGWSQHIFKVSAHCFPNCCKDFFSILYYYGNPSYLLCFKSSAYLSEVYCVVTLRIFLCQKNIKITFLLNSLKHSSFFKKNLSCGIMLIFSLIKN